MQPIRSIKLSSGLVFCIVLGVLAWGKAQAAYIPLGYAEGTVAVYYNDNEERPSNQAYLRGQFSPSNPNGAYFQFSDQYPSTKPYDWNSIFSGQPVGQSQFGFAFILKAPTASIPVPTLTAYDWNGSIRLEAGPVDWTIGDYKAGSGGASNSDNKDFNSLFRGGDGTGSSIIATYTLTPSNDGKFRMDIEGALLTDGFIHWYNPSTPHTDLTKWGLSDYLYFAGSFTYDKSADTTPGIDYYNGKATFYVATPETASSFCLLSGAILFLGLVRRHLPW